MSYEAGMNSWKTEDDARQQIKDLVAEYYIKFKEPLETKTDLSLGIESVMRLAFMMKKKCRLLRMLC